MLDLHPDERFVDLYNGDGETLISNYGRIVDWKKTRAYRGTRRKIVIELKRTWTLGTLTNTEQDSTTYYKISNNRNDDYYVHRAVWFSFAYDAIVNDKPKEIPDMWDKSIFATGIRPKVKCIPAVAQILEENGISVEPRCVYTPEEFEEMEKPVEPLEMLKYLFETKKPDENEAAAFEVHHKHGKTLNNNLAKLQLLKNYKEWDRLNNDGKPYKQHEQLKKEGKKMEDLTGQKVAYAQIVVSGTESDIPMFLMDGAAKVPLDNIKQKLAKASSIKEKVKKS